MQQVEWMQRLGSRLGGLQRPGTPRLPHCRVVVVWPTWHAIQPVTLWYAILPDVTLLLYYLWLTINLVPCDDKGIPFTETEKYPGLLRFLPTETQHYFGSTYPPIKSAHYIASYDFTSLVEMRAFEADIRGYSAVETFSSLKISRHEGKVKHLAVNGDLKLWTPGISRGSAILTFARIVAERWVSLEFHLSWFVPQSKENGDKTSVRLKAREKPRRSSATGVSGLRPLEETLREWGSIDIDFQKDRECCGLVPVQAGVIFWTDNVTMSS